MAALDSRAQGPTLTFRDNEIDNALVALDRALAVVELVRHHEAACRFERKVRLVERRAGEKWGINSPGEVDDGTVSSALYFAFDEINGVKRAIRDASHRKFEEDAARFLNRAHAAE